MSRNLDNAIDNPYVGQIVYRPGSHAGLSGKVIEILPDRAAEVQNYYGGVKRVRIPSVKVRWPNGKETVEPEKLPYGFYSDVRLRDSIADLEDRRQLFERARIAIHKAKAL